MKLTTIFNVNSNWTSRCIRTILLAVAVTAGVPAQNTGEKAGTHRLPGDRITGTQREALSRLGSEVAWVFNEDEVPSYVMGNLSPRLHPQDVVAEAAAALRTHGDLFRMSASDSFELNGVDVDKGGMTHVRMAQARDGAPVAGRELVIHMDENTVLGISGNFAPEVRSVDRESIAETEDAGAKTGRQAVSVALPRNYFLNPGFESGTTYWTGQSYSWVGGSYGGGYASTPPICGGVAVTPARTGRYCACPGGNGKTSTEYLGQSVTIPSSSVSGTLSFYLRITTSERPSAYDFLKIEIWNAAGTSRLATLPAKFANNSGYTSWQNVTMPFPVTYGGSTVIVRFVAYEDSSNATTFYIDDVTLNFAGLSL